MSLGSETVRGTLTSPTFSMLANRGAGVVAAVSVLLFATVSIKAALIGTVAFALYFYVVYDVLYHRASKRFNLGTKSDFVLRVVVLFAGAIAIPKLLVRSSVESQVLLDFLGALDVPLGIALLVGGAALAFEGLGMLRKRMTVARSTAYVGEDVDGVVAFQGTARRRDDRDQAVRADGGNPEDDDEVRIMTDGGQPVEEEELATDGGRRLRRRERDPFEGTRFEPVDAGQRDRTDVSPFDPGPSPFDRNDHRNNAPEDRSSRNVPDRTPLKPRSQRRTRVLGRPENARHTASGAPSSGSTSGSRTSSENGDRRPSGGARSGSVSTNRARTGGRQTKQLSVDPEEVDGDPIAVDGDTGEVVATRSDCTIDGWRKAIVKWLVKSFGREYGIDLREDPEALSRMASVADRAREDLTERPETEILLPFIAELDGDAVHIRRHLVAVHSDGTPRTEPPFGSAAKERSRSEESTEASTESASEASTVEQTGDVGSDIVDEADTRVEPPSSEVDAEDDPERSESESETTPDEDEEEAGPTATDVDEEATEELDVEGPVAVRSPRSGKERVAYRHRRRSKLSRPKLFEALPVDGEKANELLPDTVPVGSLLNRGVPVPKTDRRLPVPGTGLLPNAVNVPDLPDLYEDDDEEPGVRMLAADKSGGVPFDLDSFGRIRVNPEGADVAMSPDASGTDGPGFWYEAGVEPGDRITVIGNPSTDTEGDADMVVDGTEGRVIISDGESQEIKSRLGKGGLARLGAGVSAAAAGSSMAFSTVSVGSLALPAAALLGGAFAVSNRDKVGSPDDMHDQLVESVADRVHEVETEDEPSGRVSTTIHRVRTAPWRTIAEITDAVQARRD